jgi:hypothetical protein
MKKALFLSAAVVTLGFNGPALAEVTGVVMTCNATGPGIAVCGTAAIILNELSAREPFGQNGEIMKALTAPVKIIEGNVKGAERESGELAKGLRISTGISVRAIEENGGVLGGGLSGGPNSFFRKNLGIRF